MKRVVVLKATWCGPCKVYSPIVEEAKEDLEYRGFTVETMDVDENQEFVTKHGVRGIPTTLFMEDDKVTHTLIGIKTKDELLKTAAKGND
jgi:thioredoxin 1